MVHRKNFIFLLSCDGNDLIKTLNLLTDSANQKRLDWLARLRIAEDAAKGLICNLLVVHGHLFFKSTA
jgi:hypothetical protein